MGLSIDLIISATVDGQQVMLIPVPEKTGLVLKTRAWGSTFKRIEFL